MLVCTISAKKRKTIGQRHIFIAAVVANTTALLLRGDFDRPADAAILFAPMTAYIKQQATAFLSATTLTAVQPLLLAFLDLIPWSIILLVGAVVSWQAYTGYQSYEREDLSGAGKSFLNVLVLVALLFTAAKITDAMVT
jgi:heme O synthase-like polyprenyltransferase